MTFSQFLNILNNRKFSIVFIFIAVVMATYGVSQVLPQKYQATASVILNLQGVDLVTAGAGRLPINTHVGILQSRRVALKVVENLRLNSEQRFITAFLKANENGNLEINNFIADQLIENLRVGAGRKLGVISIGYTGTSPVFVTTVANAYVDAYIDIVLEMNNDAPKRTAVWFEKEVENYEQAYQENQATLAAFQKANGIFESAEFNYEKDYLATLTSQFNKTKTDLNQLNQKLNEVDSELGNYSSLFEDATIEQIRIDLNLAKIEFYKNAANLNENHPEYKTSISRVSSLRSFLKEETKVAFNKQLKKQESMKRALVELEKRIETQKQKISSLSSRFNELEALQNKVEESKQTFMMAKDRLNQILLQSKSSASESEISILSLATIPTEPESSKALKIIVLGVVLGFMLAIGYAMLRELINRRVRIDDDILVSVGLPVLGHLQDGSKRQ